MSTYSWSYKTAVHRQVSTKRAKTDQEGPDKNALCQIESDNVLQSSSSQNNDAVSIVTPKRLNWRAKIYVGNLNKKTSEASLAYYFSVFGDIEDIKLIRDHDTKESRGFAFITFEKIESAEKAKKWCSFNYPTLDDNNITVASAERKTHKIKVSKNEQRAKRDPSQTLFWEFKWTNTNDAQVYGPYETSLMQAWKNQGYFDRGCWVRQVPHRQLCRGGEKHEVQANTSEVTRAEDIQNANTNTFERNAKDESCEASPCKKPKLVIEYSDSEEEGDDDDDDEEECGGVLDADGRSTNILPHESEHLKLPENEKENYSSLNKEHLQLRESNHKLDSLVEVKQDERESSSEQYENEHLKLPENEKQNDSSLNKEHLQLHESNHELDSVVEAKQDVRESSSEQYENEHLKLPENQKQNDSSLNKEHLRLHESNHELDSVVEAKQDVRESSSEQYENEHLKLPENEKQNDSSLNKEHLQLHESNHKLDLVVEVKQDERMSSSDQYEGEHLRLSENEKENDCSLNKEQLQPNESDLSTVKVKQKEVLGEGLGLPNDEGKECDVNETRLKHIEREDGESVREGIHAVKMHNNILEQHEHRVQTHEESKQKQNTSIEDNLRLSYGDHEQSISNKVEENLDILQMYEQGSSVLSEHDEQGERKINDEDLRLSDDSSSGEEDIENDDDDISTEFVGISEIDFNLYP